MYKSMYLWWSSNSGAATALVGLEEALGATDGRIRVLRVLLAVVGGLIEAAGGGTSEEGADELFDDLHVLE